jgi:hypothetical protein
VHRRANRADDEQPDPPTKPLLAVPVVPLPPVPRGWVLVPVTTIRDLIAVVAGGACVSADLTAWLMGRELNVALLVIGAGLLGLPIPLRAGDQKGPHP